MRPAYWELHKRGRLSAPVQLGRKFCTGCGRWRLLVDFDRLGEIRIRPRCRACTRAYMRAWRANATPVQLARMREYAASWERGRTRPRPAATPAIVLGRRFCTGCGRWRLLIDFGQRDGKPKARCQACTRAAQRIYKRALGPAQRERIREYQRFWYEAKRHEAGIEPRRYRHPTVVDRVERVLLEPAPLLSEIERAGLTDLELSALAGVSARTIHRLRVGEARHVRLDVADKLAVGLDVPLALIYETTEERTAA